MKAQQHVCIGNNLVIPTVTSVAFISTCISHTRSPTSYTTLPEFPIFSLGRSHNVSIQIVMHYNESAQVSFPSHSCPAPSISQYCAQNRSLPSLIVKVITKICHATCNRLCRVTASSAGCCQSSCSLGQR